MSKFIVEHVPSFTEYHWSGIMMNFLINSELPSVQQKYLWDMDYWIVSLEDWGKIFRDVLLNMPKYTVDKFDCDNFGLLTSARVSMKYQLNTCAIAIGSSPWGEHGYNAFPALVDDTTHLFILEPQDGMIYEAKEDSGYKPRLIIMG